ncbi:carboxypeptidase-like regulatory domain-containing protein [Flavobacterium sp.]|uniref:carboxypeptidase-like regulatory domain-containing protein n=1 Tax=Flavobacterium sp. TaxID=239 RepID=UPI0025BD781A|nr:carboxypeptidase-like regulatory domain-containing protein [Flavobacterium sp.]
MKKLILLFIFCPLLAVAQNIKGVVVSQKGSLPLENTNILALSSKTGTITDENGKFSLKLLPEFKNEETIEFSHLGYKTIRISLSYLTRQNFTVSLEENVENLSGVTIASNSKLKTKISFSKLASLKYPIFSFGSFLKEDKIYVSGGDAYSEVDQLAKVRAKKADPNFQDFLEEAQNTGKRHYKKHLSVYDIKNNTWEVQDLKLLPRAYHNIHLYNNLIYVLGGKKIMVNKISSWEYLQDKIEVVDLDKHSIKIDKANPHQAADFASFSYNDNIIVAGGSVKMDEKGKKDFTDKMHLYNITSGYWYELPSMLTAKETTGILIDNKIYFIGGYNGKPLSQIETFDLTTEKWGFPGELFTPLERPAIAYNNNIIYFFEDRKMYTYDLKTKQLKEFEIELESKRAAMYYYNNKLYLIGGRIDNSYSQIPSEKVFSIDLDEFETTKPNKTKILSQEVNAAKPIE